VLMIRLVVVMTRVIRPLGFTTLVAGFINLAVRPIRLGSHVSGRPRLLMVRLVLTVQMVVRRDPSLL
jgi:hypothetical protein